MSRNKRARDGRKGSLNKPQTLRERRENREKEPQSKPRDEDFIEENLVEGRNGVLELLNAEKTIHRLFVRSGDADGSLKVILAKAKEQGIIISTVSKHVLDEMSQTGKHQGIIALCPPFEYATLRQVLADCAAKSESPFLVVLDKIYDPHNLGAIIRTACACGAHAVVIPKRRSVSVTAAVVRASAGAAGHLPIVRVSNIAQALEAMKEAGIWTVGAEFGGQNIYDTPLSGAVAVVIGNESEGISRLVKDKCDFLVSIPMPGAISSLNASVAAGVVMYEVVRRRMYGLR